MKILPINISHSPYQVIFTKIEEALKDAKEQSARLHTRLHIIFSHNLFFVDADDKIYDLEILYSVYENGKQITV